MVYEVTLEKNGRTIKIIVEDVKSEDEAKLKAIIEAEEGFTVSKTRLI